jgi:hypothetical protein
MEEPLITITMIVCSILLGMGIMKLIDALKEEIIKRKIRKDPIQGHKIAMTKLD